MHLCSSHLHSCPSPVDSFLDLPPTCVSGLLRSSLQWRRQNSPQSPAKSLHLVAAHEGLWLCWPQSRWEGRTSGCPASPLACYFPARRKLSSIWSGDKPASVYHSETRSTDPAIVCHDPHSPETPYPGTCSSLEPSVSRVLMKNTAEAFSEFCEIGAVPPARLGGTEFAYSGLAGSI